jgi:hypothetical protein
MSGHNILLMNFPTQGGFLTSGRGPFHRGNPTSLLLVRLAVSSFYSLLLLEPRILLLI